MKTTFKLLAIVGIAFLAQSFFNPAIANEKTKGDPRIQVEDNKVKIWVFNEQQSNLTIKVYDERRNIIQNVSLGDGLTVGKILDFNSSDNTYYRVVVSAGKEVLYNKKIRLGTK
nr:hypothetical protein [Allomuricauda sp.]